MKHLFNRQQHFNTQFLYHERGTDDHVDNIREVLQERTAEAKLSEAEIHDYAHKFARLIAKNEDFAAAFVTALGEEVEAHEVGTWVNTLETHLEIERHEDGEPSSVRIPLSTEEFNKIYDSREGDAHIPDQMRPEIESYVLHNLETSATPDNTANTTRLSDEDIETSARVMIENQAIFLKITKFGQTQLDGTPVPSDPEAEAESVSDVARRVSGEFEHVSPDMLMRAMAGNHKGFGMNEAVPKDLTEEGIRDLAKQLNTTGEEIDTDLRARGLTPGTPAYQQAYTQRMNDTINSLSDVKTLGDLLKLFLRHMYPEQYGQNGGPFDSNGRPLGTTVPNGSTRSRGSMENIEGHPGEIHLNPAFYGEEMIAQYEALPESSRKAVETITEGWDDGWKLPVMRNAINSQRYGQVFSADRPFFANDLGTKRALIYIPGEGTIKTTCFGGSGGISNVSESHGSPLGSFNFKASDVAYLPNHRYRARATVHGMEPMRQNFRTSYEQGGNIDPSAGNSNSAGRAILMHGSSGTTWGCWGIPQEHAVKFAQAIQAGNPPGANGEAFVSTSRPS